MQTPELKAVQLDTMAVGQIGLWQIGPLTPIYFEVIAKFEICDVSKVLVRVNSDNRDYIWRGDGLVLVNP